MLSHYVWCLLFLMFPQHTVNKEELDKVSKGRNQAGLTDGVR